jgi:hypothetical protein
MTRQFMRDRQQRVAPEGVGIKPGRAISGSSPNDERDAAATAAGIVHGAEGVLVLPAGGSPLRALMVVALLCSFLTHQQLI